MPMSLFEQLDREATRAGLRFLVIGGHAVIEHGFQRGTEDTDLLVCKDDRLGWIEVLTGVGFSVYHDGGPFLQFKPADSTEWNLDLMLVPSETFERFVASAKTS